MGEIADALKRAREEAKRGSAAPAAVAPDPIAEVAETVAAVAPIIREATAPSGSPAAAPLEVSASRSAHIAAEKADSWIARAVLADHHGRFGL